MDPRRFWPFLIPEAQETKRQVAFFEQANREGFKAFDQGSLIGALATNGREGEMIPRGGIDQSLRRYWEVLLGDRSRTDDSFYVEGFENAAEAVLNWLRGQSNSEVRLSIRQHIVQKPGERGW